MLSNSANLGIVPQTECFDRDIANSDNTDGYYVIHTGDFVYNPRKSTVAPFGPVNIYNGKKVGIISPLYLCFRVSGIDADFLNFRFKSNCWYRFMYENGDSGARHDRVSIKDDIFFSMPVSLPSRDEQKTIAEFLHLLDKRIQIQNKTIEDLIRLRTALYSSLFAKGRNISTILSDMGEYYSTMNLSKDDLSPSGQECILYGELFTTYGRVITEIKSRTNIGISSGTTLSSSNDLLFPASTTVDALSLVSPSAISKNGVILGGDMFGIRLNENYNNRYMSRLLFHCYRRKLASYAQGSTIIHLHYRDIEKIKIKVHPKIEQDRIAEALDMLDNRIELEQKIVKEYSSQKNYLVKMMFI